MRTLRPFIVALALLAAASAQAATAIYYSAPQQQIDGFGVQIVWMDAPLTEADADLFFGTGPGGVGLSLARIRIMPSGGFESASEMQPDWIDGYGLENALKAQARGAKIWAMTQYFPSEWRSPPDVPDSYANWETLGRPLDPAHYEDWADRLVGFIATARAAGVNVVGLSFQNEADMNSGLVDPPATGYPEWTPATYLAFLKVLGPKLRAAEPGVAIIGPDVATASLLPDFTDPILADPVAKNYLDIISRHTPVPYPYPAAAANGKRLWIGEASSNRPWVSTIDDGLDWAYWFHQGLNEYGYSGFHETWPWIPQFYYDLYQPGMMPDTTGLQGPPTPDPSTGLPSRAWSKRLCTFAHFAKVFRPGYRVLATNAGGTAPANVYVSAVKGPSGEIGIVLTNKGTSTPSITLTGLPSALATLDRAETTGATAAAAPGTPGNVEVKGAVTVASGSVTIVLPAQSITSLSGVVPVPPGLPLRDRAGNAVTPKDRSGNPGAFKTR